MVAADSSNPYFLVMVRLATGSPVAMYSVTAAYSTERARFGKLLTALNLARPAPNRQRSRENPALSARGVWAGTQTPRDSQTGPEALLRSPAKSLTVLRWPPMISARQKIRTSFMPVTALLEDA